jgi:hypothetical protein
MDFHGGDGAASEAIVQEDDGVAGAGRERHRAAPAGLDARGQAEFGITREARHGAGNEGENDAPVRGHGAEEPFGVMRVNDTSERQLEPGHESLRLQRGIELGFELGFPAVRTGRRGVRAHDVPQGRLRENGPL